MLSRLISSTAAVLIAGAALAGTAAAQSSRVRNACSGDAQRLCPNYSLGSSELRYCMESKGRSLSHSCILALEADGIIARGTLARARR